MLSESEASGAAILINSSPRMLRSRSAWQGLEPSQKKFHRNALIRPVTGSSRTHYWLCAGWRGVSPSRSGSALSASGAPLCHPPDKRDMSRFQATTMKQILI